MAQTVKVSAYNVGNPGSIRGLCLSVGVNFDIGASIDSLVPRNEPNAMGWKGHIRNAVSEGPGGLPGLCLAPSLNFRRWGSL